MTEAKLQLSVFALLLSGCVGSSAMSSPGAVSSGPSLLDAGTAPLPGEAGELLTTISGKKLAARIANPKGKATLVNIWASWCAPCAHEFPLLLKASRALAPRGIETFLISVDAPEDRAAVEVFLRRYDVSERVYLRTGEDADLVRALGQSWTGGLPATMIFGPTGELRYFPKPEGAARSRARGDRSRRP